MNISNSKIKEIGACLIVFFINLVMNIRMPLVADDNTFIKALSQYDGLANWIKFYYTNWSGRIVPHTVLVLFLNSPKIVFDILNAGMMVLLILCMVEIAFSFMDRFVLRKWIAIIFLQIFIMLCISHDIIMDAVLWKTAAVLYVWGLCAGFITMLYFINNLVGREIKNFYIITIACAIYASNVEQVAAFTLASGLILTVVNAFIHKKVDKKEIILCVILMIGMLISLLAPGNELRKNEDILCVVPYYDMFTFREKIVWGFTMTMNHINNHCLVLFIIIAILINIVVWTRKKCGIVIKLCTFIPTIYYTSVFLLIKITKLEMFTNSVKLMKMKNYLCGYLSFNSVDFIVKRENWISTIIGMFCFWLMVILIFTKLKDTLEWISMLMFGGAFGTVYMLIFSPASQATGNRVLFPMQIMLMIVVLRIVLIAIDGKDKCDE